MTLAAKAQRMPRLVAAAQIASLALALALVPTTRSSSAIFEGTGSEAAAASPPPATVAAVATSSTDSAINSASTSTLTLAPPSMSSSPSAGLHPTEGQESPGCPDGCACHYSGSHVMAEAFDISCTGDFLNSDGDVGGGNHAVPADASNITSLRLRAVSAPAVRPLLPGFTRLRRLVWADSGLRRVPLMSLRCNRTLTTLDLSGNAIGDVFSDLLSRLPRLTRLVVSRNNVLVLNQPVLRGGGGELLRLPLLVLDLSQNLLRELATGLLGSLVPGLTHLNVSRNALRVIRGDRALLEALPHMETLDMSHNRLVSLAGVFRVIDPSLQQRGAGVDAGTSAGAGVGASVGVDARAGASVGVGDGFVAGVGAAVDVDTGDIGGGVGGVGAGVDAGGIGVDAGGIRAGAGVGGISAGVAAGADAAGVSAAFPVSPGVGSVLRSLNLSHNSLQRIEVGAFVTLAHLEELDLSHNQLTFLAAGVFATTTGHRKLRRLYLSWNRLLGFGNGALTGLSGLHTLRLDHNQLTQVEAAYFRRSVPDTSPGWDVDAGGNLITDPAEMNETRVWLRLHAVDLSHNNITDIAPSIFHSTLALVRHIDLAFNRITCLPRYGVETLTELESIDVSHNHLQWLDIGTFKNARLRTINLSHNHLVKLISMAFLYLPAVEHVDLSNNQLDYIYKYAFYKTCAFNQRLDIYLQHNELITDALWKVISSFRHLQGSACMVSLYMQNNSISYILGAGASESYRRHLVAGDFRYFSIWDHINLYVSSNEVMCDCSMYRELMLLEAVRNTFSANFTRPDHLLFWHDLVCHSPPRLAQRRVADVLQYMQCPLTKGCPNRCACLFQPLHGVIEVDCAGRNLTQFPGELPTGRKELHLRGNRLGVLRGDINLTEVTYIDLTFNNLRYIDQQAWELLLLVPVLLLSDNALETLPWSDQNLSVTLNLTLSNNAFQCTCDNILFRDWLVEHTDKVYDAFNVSCANGHLKGLALLDADDADFECYPEEGLRTGVPLSLFMLILSVMLLGGVLLGSLVYHYRLYVKLFCVQRWPWRRYPGDDPDNKTDVFVCYSFGDSKWVNRQLVPRLLSHFPPYSVLLQHRDTKPGALLSQDLIDSIESSEVTLLVLSYKFLRNEWAHGDCRHVLQQSLQDEVQNVYVVLLDDTVLEDMEPEVTECVRMQHCFSVCEDWFWERLFHMMPPPHTALRRRDEEQQLKAELQSCVKY